MSYNLKGSKVISLHNELQNDFINTSWCVCICVILLMQKKHIIQDYNEQV